MTNTIEKTVDIAAPVDRVWRALTDPVEFGAWFGAELDTSFAVGQVARGHITSPGYEHLVMEMTVTRIEPPRAFEFTWHPYAVDPKVDYSTETPTVVAFFLEPIATGTRLVVVESGFDALPPHRLADALRMNDSGWAEQMMNIRRHVEG